MDENFKLTPERIEGTVAHEYYTRVPNTTATICALTLHNGFTVIGHSACLNEANFDDEVGRTLARQDAIRQIWAHEGYAVKALNHSLSIVIQEQMEKHGIDGNALEGSC